MADANKAALASIRRILGLDKRTFAPKLTGAAKIRASGRIHPIQRVGGKPEVVPGGSVDIVVNLGKKKK